MYSATITDAKNGLSRLLDQVRHGKTIVITDRNRPIARLSPIGSGDADACDGRVLRLERAGLMTRAHRSAPPALLAESPPALARGVSVLSALAAEREEGR